MKRSKFHHEEIYRGTNFEEFLRQRITICGAGALGSNLVDTLARQGFSNLRVIDKDRVETHNINTQVWSETDVGALKVEALKNKMFRDVGVELDTISKELTATNAAKFLRGSALVVDCFDNSASRKVVQDTCRGQKYECLHIGLNTDYGEIIWDAEYRVPKDVAGDICDYPLARNLVILTVSVAAEEIVDWSLAGKARKCSWSITLRDFAIRRIL